MASYKVRVPTGFNPATGGYKVRVPTGFSLTNGAYNVRVPSSGATTEQTTVDISAAPAGVTVSWTISPDPGGGNDTGSGTNATPPWVFQAPFDTYTIHWEDSDIDYIPPGDEVLILTLGNPITFALS